MNHDYHEQLNHFVHFFIPAFKNLRQLILMIIVSVLVGAVSGSVGVLFYHALSFVTAFRMAHSYMVYFLPAAGLIIVFLYKITGQFDNKGTNLMLSAIQSNDFIPFRVAPLMFVSTMITHLFGGSAGREGAALQIGGSLGETIAIHMNLDDDDKHIIIMCAMSACFSAVFGTPLAAAVFSMEVISIGIMHYAALVPCVVAAETASIIARHFHAMPELMPVTEVPELSFLTGGSTIVCAAAFAGVSVLFCIILHVSEHTYKKYIKNPYFRVIAGGCLVILLSLIFRTTDYQGAGMPVIMRCFEGGSVPFYAFLLKILFTAITLGAGFKGGEIVPSFFTGATLGCVIGPLLGLPAPLAAGCGMVGVFCGVTNSPITSLLIAFELFGFAGAPYYLLSIAVCYMLSGYYGLYSSQKIVYSKYHTKYINRFTK